jgi:hypothetical protein
MDGLVEQVSEGSVSSLTEYRLDLTHGWPIRLSFSIGRCQLSVVNVKLRESRKNR